MQLSFSGMKSDNPLSPAYVPSIFSCVKVSLLDKRKEKNDRSMAAEALLDLSQDSANDS